MNKVLESLMLVKTRERFPIVPSSVMIEHSLSTDYLPEVGEVGKVQTTIECAFRIYPDDTEDIINMKAHMAKLQIADMLYGDLKDNLKKLRYAVLYDGKELAIELINSCLDSITIKE